MWAQRSASRGRGRNSSETVATQPRRARPRVSLGPSARTRPRGPRARGGAVESDDALRVRLLEDDVRLLEDAGLGGARVVATTVPDRDAMGGVVDGLSRNGELVVLGASDQPVRVAPFQLIMRRRRVQGWPSGTARDSEDALHFSALRNVRPKVETKPLEEAEEAYRRVIDNEARFRMVLTTG